MGGTGGFGDLSISVSHLPSFQPLDPDRFGLLSPSGLIHSLLECKVCVRCLSVTAEGSPVLKRKRSNTRLFCTEVEPSWPAVEKSLNC